MHASLHHRLPELRGGYIKKSREADNKSKDCFSVVGLFFLRGENRGVVGRTLWWLFFEKTLDD